MMELWHLGLCLLCLVTGTLLGAIVDISHREDAAKAAYKRGYKDGKEDGREERD